jgi:hypothetical protein
MGPFYSGEDPQLKRAVAEGCKASRAVERLRQTAPTFATRADDALREGDFAYALTSIEFAVGLEPQNGAYKAMRGNVLQVLKRWSEALEFGRGPGDFWKERKKIPAPCPN